MFDVELVNWSFYIGVSTFNFTFVVESEDNIRFELFCFVLLVLTNPNVSAYYELIKSTGLFLPVLSGWLVSVQTFKAEYIKNDTATIYRKFLTIRQVTSIKFLSSREAESEARLGQ